MAPLPRWARTRSLRREMACTRGSCTTTPRTREPDLGCCVSQISDAARAPRRVTCWARPLDADEWPGTGRKAHRCIGGLMESPKIARDALRLGDHCSRRRCPSHRGQAIWRRN
jgi:hypothetical protein